MENVENYCILIYINNLIVEKIVDYVFKTFLRKKRFIFSTISIILIVVFSCGGDGIMNVDILWSNFLGQIKEELTSLSYNTWFSETELYKLEDGKAYIIVPMPIHKKHLMDNFSTIYDRKAGFNNW